MQFYLEAIKAFHKCEEYIETKNNGQLHYTLGIAYFKSEQYNKAVEHLKLCIQIDPFNFYANNNLAFIYNMHEYYQETFNLCI